MFFVKMKLIGPVEGCLHYYGIIIISVENGLNDNIRTIISEGLVKHNPAPFCP